MIFVIGGGDVVWAFGVGGSWLDDSATTARHGGKRAAFGATMFG